MQIGQRARTGKGRRRLIGGDGGELRRRIGPAVPGGAKGRGVILEALAVRPVPARDRRGRPFRRLVGVAVVAGVGRAERRREVRARNAEAVVVPDVHHHVGARRHVAGNAGRRRIDAFVVAMGDGRVFLRRVALRADLCARRAKLCAVRLVAVAAGHAGREHAALLERAVIVDLVAHLTVGDIEPARQRRHHMGVGQRAPRHPVFGEFAAARMAAAAGLDLLARRRRREVARGIAGLRIDRPGDAAALVEPRQKPHTGIVALAERPPMIPRVGPIHVARTFAVARLAADGDLGEVRREAILRGVVVLAHAGRMTLGAHEIPVLIELRPMQDVVVLDVLFRVEVKPALAALRFRPCVPGERERLHAAVGKLDEVLLQGIEAEGVFHLEGGEVAVRPVGLDEKLAVLAEEPRVHAVIVEARIVEIAEHRGVGRVGHGVGVLRRVPERGLAAMASGAGLAADEGWRCRDVGAGCEGRVPQAVGREIERDAACDQQRDSDRGEDRHGASAWRPGLCGLRWWRRLALHRSECLARTSRSTFARRLAGFARQRYRLFGMPPGKHRRRTLRSVRDARPYQT